MTQKLDVNALNARFETAPPEEILRWAIETFRPRIALSSSFGGESAGLIHMATRIDPSIPILFLDTGFLFKETHAFKDRLKDQFKLNVREFRATPAEIEDTKRNLAARKDIDGKCCDDSKVRLMQQALEGLDCWIAGLRRQQSATRKGIGIVEEVGDGLIKVHPLANGTSKDVYAYMTQHHLPFHPLWEKGFTSIGCEPCTVLPLPGEDARSGRWAGLEKKECGIHTFMEKKNP